jgi:hypothetical protein
MTINDLYGYKKQGTTQRSPDRKRSRTDCLFEGREKEQLCGRDKIGIIDQYRMSGLTQLEEALKVYEREVRDMTREFGEFNPISLVLFEIIECMLDALGEFGQSNALRILIMAEIEKVHGVSHQYYMESILPAAKSHSRVGEWMEAQVLLEKGLQHMENTHETHNEAAELIMIDLASIYKNTERWNEAEELEYGLWRRERVSLAMRIWTP